MSDGFREDPPDRPEDVMFADILLSPALQVGFRWLATVDVEAVFRRRAVLMKTVPVFMQGAHRSAMRVATSEIDAGRSNGDRTRSAAGWRLFMLLPRFLLFRPPRRVGAEVSVVSTVSGVLSGGLAHSLRRK